MPRFVLLYHDCPASYDRRSHWDFMLEAGEKLRTWALEQLPSDWLTARSRTARIYPDCPSAADGNAVAAIPLGDHRRDYLEFEGPLSGNRGTVIRVAAGNYDGKFEPSEGWRITLDGNDLSGSVELMPSSVDDTEWRLTCLLAG